MLHVYNVYIYIDIYIYHFTQLPFPSMLAAYVSQLGVEVQAIVASI